jgi:Zn-dependent membrane protease YugP
MGFYLVFFIVPMLLGFAAQGWLRKTVARGMAVDGHTGMTGGQIARQILDRNGLGEVPVEAAPGGPLSDHYDPRSRSVHLSQGVFDGAAVASVAIAAHEVGHAIQHQHAYAPFRARSALFPAVALASNAWFLLLILGFAMGAVGLVQIAVVLFAAIVLFQLVTLPVEFDASRRALVQLRELGFVTEGERTGARKVLTAAAMTYVVAALVAVSQLVFLVLQYLGNRQ